MVVSQVLVHWNLGGTLLPLPHLVHSSFLRLSSVSLVKKLDVEVMGIEMFPFGAVL